MPVVDEVTPGPLPVLGGVAVFAGPEPVPSLLVDGVAVLAGPEPVPSLLLGGAAEALFIALKTVKQG